MPPEPVVLRPTIDRLWLERAARLDPVAHAYALWDLDQYPDRIRFVSLLRGEATLGYLLIWLGHPTTPIVHWFGGEETSTLAAGLPPRPLVAIVPEEARADVERARGPVEVRPLLQFVASPDSGPGREEPTSGVRRLRGPDRPQLAAWSAGRTDFVVSEYPHLDPDREAIWGCFERETLVGVARAVVRLPTVWILGGVYVDPPARGRGFGLALVRTVLAAGRREGATVGLNVREDRPAARVVYERAGFRLRARRWWIGAGTDFEP